MTRSAAHLLTEALELPAPQRAELAGSLLASLDGPADPEAESAWAVEVERRLADIDAGTVETVSWAETRRLLRGGE